MRVQLSDVGELHVQIVVHRLQFAFVQLIVLQLDLDVHSLGLEGQLNSWRNCRLI